MGKNLHTQFRGSTLSLLVLVDRPEFVILAWRREANKKGRKRRPQRYPLSDDNFPSSIDQEIFNVDWSLGPGWSCETAGGIFDRTLVFIKGDER
jgi:hypothetical protein